jgi:hypothetical protein
MTRDHDQPFIRLHEFEDDLKDVPGLITEVDDVRASLHHRELAIVERDRDIDPAQITRPSRIFHHLPMRVPRLRQQVLEHIVTLDLANAEQLRPQAAMQLVQDRRQVLLLRLERLRRPPLRRRELEVARDRVVLRIEQVLQVPPGNTDRAHPDPPPDSDSSAPTPTDPALCRFRV